MHFVVFARAQGAIGFLYESPCDFLWYSILSARAPVGLVFGDCNHQTRRKPGLIQLPTRTRTSIAFQ